MSLLQTCSQLGQTPQRSHFEQALLVSCMCCFKSLGNYVFAIADAGARLGGRDFGKFVRLLQEKPQKEAAPVSLDKLDTRRWLGRQRHAALRAEIAKTFPVTESAPVPKYLWDVSGNCGRWASCMSS